MIHLRQNQGAFPTPNKKNLNVFRPAETLPRRAFDDLGSIQAETQSQHAFISVRPDQGLIHNTGAVFYTTSRVFHTMHGTFI
jgi:hypothetical protein